MTRRADALIVLACLVTGAWVGARTYGERLRSGPPPLFYQGRFGPAVLTACGRDFRDPVPADSAELTAFLTRRRDAIACDSIPDNMRTAAPELFQRASRYLLLSASAVWRVTGVSWQRLDILAALFTAVAAAGAYLLFRSAGGAVVSAFLVAVFLAGAAHLSQVPNLRDYSKAPFLIGLFAVMAAALSRAGTARRLIALAAVAGIAGGVGLGFRTDLFQAFPAAAVAFALAPVATTGWQAWKSRLVAATTFVATAALAAAPILFAYAGGNNTWHVVALGLAEPFTEALQLRPASYAASYVYNDSYVHTVIVDYAHRTLPAIRDLGLETKGYELASRQYLLGLVALAPADTALRWIAAVVRVYELPFTDALPVVGVLRFPLALATRAAGWLALGAPLLLALRRPRDGALWFLFAVFFAGVASLQYETRHVFHLAVLPLFSIGALVAIARWFVITLRRDGFAAVRPTLAGAVVAGALILVPAGVLTGLRGVQAGRLTTFSKDLARRADRMVPTAPTPGLESGTTLLRVPPEERTGLRGRYFRVQFARCDAVRLPLTVRYQGSDASLDFSHRLVISPRGTASTLELMLPGYDLLPAGASGPVFSFMGLELPAGDAACVSRVGQIDAQDVPYWLYLQHGTAGEAGRPYQSLQMLRGSEPEILTKPALTVYRSMLTEPGRPPAAGNYQARGARVDDGRIAFNGIAAARYGYVWGTNPERIGPSEVLRVEGDLWSGGITVGLQYHGAWGPIVNLTRTGPFVVFVKPPSPGDYSVVIAHALAQGELRSSFEIRRVRWLNTGSGEVGVP